MLLKRVGAITTAALLMTLLLAVGVRGQDRALTTIEADLLARALAGEEVRVIVGFTMPDAPQGMADDPAIEAVYMAQMDAARDALTATLEVSGEVVVKEASRDWFIPFVAMQVDAAAYQALLAHPFVTSIEEDAIEFLSLAQTIPIVNADDMWALGFTGAGNTVAVLDTGATASHPSYGGRVVAEACFSTDNADGNSICPNGAATQTGNTSSSPLPCLAVFPVNSGCEHGSNVTGIVGANNATIKGTATEVSLISINVFSDVFAFSQPVTYVSDQVSGLNHVYSLRNSYNIAAVNMSLGGGKYTAACDAAQMSRFDAMNQLRGVGIATVVATGNNGFTDGISAPSCISLAVAVSATDDSDVRASFANTLPSMTTLFAPGVGVFSSYPPGYGSPLGYGTMSGTSQATPHVAGGFALLNQAVPGLTVSQYVTALRSGGVNITVPGGTIPRINLTGARTWLINNNAGVIMNIPRQGRPSAPTIRLALPVNVQIKRISDGGNVVNGSYTPDFAGRHSIVIGANANYRVRVKGVTTLAETVNANVTGTMITITLPALREGDANNDNVINVSDFSLLASSFGLSSGSGGFNANADFNGDGTVNITDFSLMAANFGQAGAAP
jgi:subtilisin family serine protease